MEKNKNKKGKTKNMSINYFFFVDDFLAAAFFLVAITIINYYFDFNMQHQKDYTYSS